MTARRLAPYGAAIAVAAVLWLLFGGARALNYDSSYSLLWGSDLVGGHAPDLDVPFAPTQHPLATLFGLVLALPGLGEIPRGAFAENAWEVVAFLTLGAIAWLIYALGRAWFTTAAGVLAAVVFLTREPVLSYGVRAYIDLPYTAFLLGALLLETRRSRAGTPVLVLLALAGLLRPEAWLLTLAYLAWLWRGGALRPVHLAVAVSGPLLWALSDLALTGDPLRSLTGTREGADELERTTGISNIPETVPRRLGEILREPVLVGAAVGGVLGLWRLRERARLGAVVGVVAIVAFCVLAVAGLPLLTRYLLFPAALLSVFCGAGLAGWTLLPRDDPFRRPWMALAALTLVLVVVFAPSQVRRLDRLHAALATQHDILDELRGFSPLLACDDPALPNRRAVPQLALWADVAPGAIRTVTWSGAPAALPVSQEIADQFVLDARDKDRSLPPAPSQTPTATGRFWRVWACRGLDGPRE